MGCMMDLPTPDESIAGLSDAYRSGQTTPRDVVERCLERITASDSLVRAWVLVDREGALMTADRLTDEARQGRWRGPLHGIPLGIKDIVDVAGMPTLAGSTIRPNAPAQHDATLVERLRAAGAIILGKTVTTEFACFDPSPTRNPWNLAHTPGGSSSGSAAAVALGMCVAAIGSQTGGSITRPASYCGICGLKPTYGRISVAGVLPVSAHLDHPGPMARSVADLAHLLAVMAGPDPRDPLASDVPPADYVSTLTGASPPRLGLLEEFFENEADEETLDSLRQAVERWQQAGARVASAPLPQGFDRVHLMHRRIMAVDAAEVLRSAYEEHRSELGPHVAALIEEGLAVSAMDYAKALQHHTAFRQAAADLAGQFDALLLPATPTAAPADLTTTGDPRFNSPWSYAGLPTVSVPCGLTREGMPLAAQWVGTPWNEASLLATAAWCENQLGFRHQPTLDGR